MNFFSKILCAASFITVVYGIAIGWFWLSLFLVAAIDATWIYWRIKVRQQLEEENRLRLKKSLRKLAGYTAARESMWWLR